ncbi:MAG: ATP-binding protein [Bacteroidota bacterium]
MTNIKQYKSQILFAILFFMIASTISYFLYFILNEWEKNIIEENKALTERAVEKMSRKAEKMLLKLNNKNMFSENITNKELNKLDSILKIISKNVLREYKDFKGGFYLINAGRFVGYAFPDSKPPYPVYGPPPRSYTIIKDQVLRSAKEQKLIIQLHRFDPEVFFPLATKPVIVNNEVAIIAWSRTHIERKLPLYKLRKGVTYIAVVSITILVILIYFTIKIRSDIRKINTQLDYIQNDPNYRLQNKRGVFGNIINYVNGMLERLQKGNNERRKLEKQLHRKEKMASLGRVSAGIAHEVKTPLAIIKTRIQIWQKQLDVNLKEKIDKDNSLEMVEGEINRLSKLINRLLIFARPISKNMKFCDINELIKEIGFMIKMKEVQKEITCVTNLSNDLPKIEIDENSIKQVIINVLTNAQEAIPEKGTIDIETTHDQSNNNINVIISNTGKGIPKDVMSNIFEPFFTTKETGVGLGLAISYQIVKAHNGTIKFINKADDKGVKCVIKLPEKQDYEADHMLPGSSIPH